MESQDYTLNSRHKNNIIETSEQNEDLTEFLKEDQLEIKKVDLRRLINEHDSPEEGTPLLRP